MASSNQKQLNELRKGILDKLEEWHNHQDRARIEVDRAQRELEQMTLGVEVYKYKKAMFDFVQLLTSFVKLPNRMTMGELHKFSIRMAECKMKRGR